MLSQQLQASLTEYAARASGHEDHRRYIGLSGIGDCERVIYDRYFAGDRHSQAARLKDSLGYALEAHLVGRLEQMGLYRPVSPISLYDGLVQGHPDGEVGGDLLEIKTIERVVWLPELPPPRLPNRVFYQVQAYLLYTGYTRAHVVYLARDTGEIRVVGVTRSESIGFKITERIDRVVGAVQTRQRPECSCGHCRSQDGEAQGGRP